MRYPYVAADTETTGLQSELDEIVEVTAIEFDLDGNCGERIVQRCRPIAGYIPHKVTEIHGITYEMVKDEPSYLKDGVHQKVAKFINQRTLVGHNIIKFDLGFLKIKPKYIEDTLVMCRKKSRGRNNLKAACKKNGIKWDDSKSHGAEYDTEKTIELFVKMKANEAKEKERHEETPLFAQANTTNMMISKDKENVQMVSSSDFKSMGIIPDENDRKMFTTQAYSFSRINLFNQCPFKWYMQYIKKIKQPQINYLTTGSICHKIAEWAGKWCNRELFANKFVSFANSRKLSINAEVLKELSNDFNKPLKDINNKDFGIFLYDNPKEIKKIFENTKGLADMTYKMDQDIKHDSYEIPSMPDYESYDFIIQDALNLFKCIDTDIINDVKVIMYKFAKTHDFSLTPGDVNVTEMKLAFDKDWNRLKDFYSNKTFFRGIVDVIDYYGDYVIITDYKSSRTMLTQRQLQEDMQMLVYLLLVSKLLGDNKYNKIILRINYIRYGKTVEYEVPNVEAAKERALKWIDDSIQKIEKEMLKDDGTAFQPIRNEYCHYCHIGEDGRCPLFNKNFINNIDDPYKFIISDIEDCQAAWKRIEANKAENSRLTSLCKKFVKNCSDRISIDEHAALDFYIAESREFDSSKAATLLLKKKVDIRELMAFFSISQSSMKSLLEWKKMELTNEELDLISKIKRKGKFDAFTKEEIEKGNFLNA